MINPSALVLQPQEFQRTALTRDACDLFSGQKAGHMGAWQYQEPLHETDPAGGAALWAAFVRNAPDYYLFEKDVALIESRTKLLNILQKETKDE